MKFAIGEILTYIISTLGIIVTLLGIFIAHMLQQRSEKRKFDREKKEILMMDDWKNFHYLIKKIANDFSYYMEKSRLMVTDPFLEIINITKIKLELLDMEHNLNEQLLHYHDLLEKMIFHKKQDYELFHQYYDYVCKEMINRRKDLDKVLEHIENNRNEYSKQIDKFTGDQHLLDSVIQESNNSYQYYIHKKKGECK